jgi:hypothetical protein
MIDTSKVEWPEISIPKGIEFIDQPVNLLDTKDLNRPGF